MALVYSSTMVRIQGRQTLLFDADDTLWENYIYFEQAIANFIGLLDHTPHSKEEVRATLDRCERENIARIGYGLRSFETSLVDCFTRLLLAPPDAEQRARINAFAWGIAHEPVRLLPGVAQTLADLATRHDLVLVTKGHPLEQMEKLRRSGLQPLFAATEVLAEKDPAAYVELRQRHGWPATTCWMIGNSPRSDIDSALAAGLHAIHVPHAQTWVLEHCDIREPEDSQRLLRIASFAMLSHFF